MKTYSSEIKIIEKEIKKLIKVSCDICGKESGDDEWTETYDRSGSSFIDEEIKHEVEVSMTVTTQNGDWYWADFSSEDLNIDVCPGCFINEILTLKKQTKIVTRNFYHGT